MKDLKQMEYYIYQRKTANKPQNLTLISFSQIFAIFQV